MAAYTTTIEELYSLVRANPFQTIFHLYSECMNQETTEQIASFFQSAGLKATMKSSGYLISTWFVEVEIKLPPTLSHKPIPTPPINYMETYVPPCKGLNIASEDF